MRNLFLVCSLLFLFGIRCGKDKLGDKPLLQFDDVNTTTLPRLSVVTFDLSFSSKHVVDSIYVEKLVPTCPDSEFHTTVRVPKYPESLNKGNVTVSLSNGTIDGYSDLGNPKCGEDDDAVFRFVLKDEKGNISDTVESPIITILL